MAQAPGTTGWICRLLCRAVCGSHGGSLVRPRRSSGMVWQLVSKSTVGPGPTHERTWRRFAGMARPPLAERSRRGRPQLGVRPEVRAHDAVREARARRLRRESQTPPAPTTPYGREGLAVLLAKGFQARWCVGRNQTVDFDARPATLGQSSTGRPWSEMQRWHRLLIFPDWHRAPALHDFPASPCNLGGERAALVFNRTRSSAWHARCTRPPAWRWAPCSASSAATISGVHLAGGSAAIPGLSGGLAMSPGEGLRFLHEPLTIERLRAWAKSPSTPATAASPSGRSSTRWPSSAPTAPTPASCCSAASPATNTSSRSRGSSAFTCGVRGARRHEPGRAPAPPPRPHRRGALAPPIPLRARAGTAPARRGCPPATTSRPGKPAGPGPSR